MKVLEIDNSSIACIDYAIPFQSKMANLEPKYEWFYFDLTTDDNSHIVLIISLLDSFYTKKGDIPASIYLTWHSNNKLLAYSYTIYKTDSEKKYVNDLIYNFISKKTEILELLLPDFSSKKYIHFQMDLPFQTDNSKNYSFQNQNKKHFWQFILNSKSCNGSIESIELNRNNNILYSLFHDKYLKLKLKKAPAYKTEFRQAQIYFDHNFGLEPLYKITDSWYWWHSERNTKNSDSNMWEVSYFFPKSKKLFFKSNATDMQIKDLQEKDIVVQTKISPFLLRWPKILKFEDKSKESKIHFNHIIESAPFYIRAKTHKVSNISSTIEVLIPTRIAQPINQILMKARQQNLKNIIQKKSQLEEKFDFKNLLEKITSRNGKSFYFASLILSKNEKIKSYFVYTLCRLVDDATDEMNNLNDDEGSLFSSSLIEILWSDNDNNYNLDFISKLKIKLSYCLRSYIDNESSENFILKGKELISQINLPKQYFVDLILGQKMDENFHQPNHFKDFYLYCYRVAGVVGLMMTKIFSVKQEAKANIAAEHLGIAMQITNILRDVKEDYAKNRVYLPKEIFEKYKILSNEEFFLDNQNFNQAKVKIIEEFSNLAVLYYINAIEGIFYIKKFRFRFCVKLMSGIYAGILGKIIQNKNDVFEKRIIVTTFEKLVIFIKILFGTHPLKAAGINHFKNLKGTITYEKI
jgi:phytoene synthase